MTTVLMEPGEPRRRVRVWFGEHVIADHVAEAATAERYEQAMQRRFAGLRTTNDPIPLSTPQPGSEPTH